MATLTLVLLVALVTGEVFGTLDLSGQHKEHELITRAAFQSGEHNFPSEYNGMVGSSDDVLDPNLFPEEAPAHCDDADFLNVREYPRTREQATQQLQKCVDHLRMRFGQAARGVARILNANNQINASMADLDPGTQCSHRHLTVTDNTQDKAKCVALEGFGRAFHGIQDLYSHSNWADLPDTYQAMSTDNPPGLHRTDTATFLDLRLATPISSQVPRNLSTGCFTMFGSRCGNRVTYDALNKDTGWVEADGSAIPDLTVRRNRVRGSFEKAVAAAIQEEAVGQSKSRDQAHAECERRGSVPAPSKKLPSSALDSVGYSRSRM
ncbi:hypothetical protein T440DRAFT_520921 [Plenodomus tracheiphilus IPT5]|uniref:CinY protein n=1 Tax=Plenodomus tracheiphilus IPT5 TaxID=1408161 RepID=A0A6A7AVP6_9PLEO|nr:hypothetical protein T440DRAFT_520921 [Plenodomus tracheiphilus IPT5]